MNDAIEILGEPMRQIEGRTAVDSDRAIDLHDGDLVAAHPSHDVLGELVSIVAATVPYGCADHFSRWCGKAEDPGRVFLCDAGCRVEWRRRWTVENCSLLLSYFLALSSRQPFELLACIIEKLNRFGVVLFRRPGVINVGIREGEQQYLPRETTQMPQYDVPCNVLMCNRD